MISKSKAMSISLKENGYQNPAGNSFDRAIRAVIKSRGGRRMSFREQVNQIIKSNCLGVYEGEILGASGNILSLIIEKVKGIG